MGLHCNKKLAALSMAIGGLLLFIIGFICAYAGFPAIIDVAIRSNLNLWNENSEGRKNWVIPPVPLLLTVYMFEVQNPQDVIDGIDTPIIKEIGPFIYEEVREKRNISTKEDIDKDHIRYGQYKAFMFRKDLSIYDDSHVITCVNAPLVGAVAIINTLPLPWRTIILREFNNLLNTEVYKDSLFNKHSVREFVFDGIMPGAAKLVLDLQKIVNNIPGLPELDLPYVFQQNGFAALNTKNDSMDREYYTINTGRSNMELYTKIEKWGLSMDSQAEVMTPEVSWWETNGGYKDSNICNAIIGTDGQQFYPGIKKEDSLYAFQGDICKSIVLEFHEEIEVKGIPTYRFTIPEYSVANNWVANIGYCMEYNRDETDWNNCAKPLPDNPEFLNLTDCQLDNMDRLCPSGLIELTRCFDNAPSTVSSPYFYMCPGFLREDVHMDMYDYDKHATYMDIEYNTGIPINVHKRVQFNLPLRKERSIDALKNLIIPSGKDINKLQLPMFWLDENADIDDENAQKIKDMLIDPMNTLEIVQWVMVGVGAIIGIIGIIFFIYIRRQGTFYNL